VQSKEWRKIGCACNGMDGILIEGVTTVALNISRGIVWVGELYK
jgi:hypothetical protein